MMLTAYNWSTLRKACSSATLSTTSSVLTDLGLSLELCSEASKNFLRCTIVSKEYSETALHVQKQHKCLCCYLIIINKLITYLHVGNKKHCCILQITIIEINYICCYNSTQDAFCQDTFHVFLTICFYKLFYF